MGSVPRADLIRSGLGGQEQLASRSSVKSTLRREFKINARYTIIVEVVESTCHDNVPESSVAELLSAVLKNFPNPARAVSMSSNRTFFQQGNGRYTVGIEVIESADHDHISESSPAKLLTTVLKNFPNPARVARLWSSYSKRNHTFFQEGKIFKILYTQLSGPGWDLTKDEYRVGRFDQMMHEKPRFFVVHHADGFLITAVLISTYTRRGSAKPYVNHEDLGRLYKKQQDNSPKCFQDERNSVGFTANEVGLPWDNNSQINYGHICAFDTECLVQEVGSITGDDLLRFMDLYWECLQRKSPYLAGKLPVKVSAAPAIPSNVLSRLASRNKPKGQTKWDSEYRDLRPFQHRSGKKSLTRMPLNETVSITARSGRHVQETKVETVKLTTHVNDGKTIDKSMAFPSNPKQSSLIARSLTNKL